MSHTPGSPGAMVVVVVVWLLRGRSWGLRAPRSGAGQPCSGGCVSSPLLLENFEFQVRGGGGAPRGRHTARCQLLAPASPGSWQAPGSKLKLGREALLWKAQGLAGEAGEAGEVGGIQEEQVWEAGGIPGSGKGTPAPPERSWHLGQQHKGRCSVLAAQRWASSAHGQSQGPCSQSALMSLECSFGLFLTV